MDEVEKSIERVTLPLALPEAAFLLSGKERRIPDFYLIISQLPEHLRAFLDPNATASGGGHSTYLLPLMDGRFLKMRIENHAIVELAAIKHPGNQ
jgi:hypothetical protein